MREKVRQLFGSEILLPDSADMPNGKAGFLAWMWFFIRPYRLLFTLMFFIRVFRYTAFAMVIYFFSLLVTALGSGMDAGQQHDMWRAITWGGAFYFCIMASYMTQLYDHLGLDRAQRGLTLFSFAHLLKLPLDWHEAQGSGAKLQRVMQARDNFKALFELYSYSLLSFLGEILAVVITIVAMKAPLYILLLFFLYVTSYMAVSWLMSLPVDRMQDSHNSLKENLVSRVYDFVSLIRVTKYFSLAPYAMENAKKGEGAGHVVMRKMRVISYLKWSLINIDVWFWMMLIIVFCVRDTLNKEMTVGACTAIIFMAHRLWASLEELALMQVNYFDNKNGFLRIRDTLSVPIQNYDVAPVVSVPAQWNKIEFRDVAFSYNERQAVLRDINLVLPRGKHIALIGPSGAGKSTLVKLLMKQGLPKGGSIMVGNADLKHVESADWLKHMALVPQDVELINTSLRENILLDQIDIDEDFYRDCLHKAYLEDFVTSLPEGDQTQVGERGIKLSGGQRQRLGIARALVRKAEIIIFDEATSSLDSESEAHIQQAMKESFADKTVLVIAHRLSTIRQADLIYVLNQGRIAESGSFAELEAQKGIFARLWAMQSDGFLSA